MSLTGVPILVPIVIVAACALAIVGLALLVRAIEAEAFYKRFVGPAPPGTLGAIRMLTCAIALIHTLWEDLPSTAALPGELVSRMGVMTVFIDGPLAPIAIPLMRHPAVLQLLQGLTALALTFALVGLWTRVSLPTAAVCYLIFGGILRQYTSLFHTGLVPLYLLILLSFLPSGDGWSLDRIRQVAGGKAFPPFDRATAAYGWGRYLCWLVIALTYVAAGLSKLNKGGLAWCSATNMRSYIYQDSLNPMQFDFGVGLMLRHFPDWFVSGLAAVGMMSELLFGLVLFSVIARHVLPVVMVGMHIGILLLQNILFFDLILIQLVFYDFSTIAHRLGQVLSGRNGAIQLRYDKLCPSAKSAVDVFRRFDLLRRFSFEEYEGSTSGEQTTSLSVVHRDYTYSGEAAIRKLALSTPMGWIVSPVMFVPGAAPILLDFLNLSLPQMDEPAKTEDSVSDVPAPKAASTRGHSLYAATACGLATLMLLSWAYRVEAYPLTAMQMYSVPKNEGIVRYFKYLAIYENGEVSRAPIEECIGAMSDSRYRRFNSIIGGQNRIDLAQKFFNICAERYNATAEPGQRIVNFQVEGWEWNFGEHPLLPELAELKLRLWFPVESSASEGNAPQPENTAL